MRDMSKDFFNTPDQLAKTRAYYDMLAWMHRTKTLMEKLLGWECFLSWESYQRKYQAQEYALGAGKSFTTPTHVAFGQQRYRRPNYDRLEQWEFRVFTPDHEELVTFNPCERMDDAWMLVQALAKQEDVERDGFHTEDIFFACIRSSIRTTIGDNTSAPLSLKELAQVTSLDVCEAIYKAYQHIAGTNRPVPIDELPQASEDQGS